MPQRMRAIRQACVACQNGSVPEWLSRSSGPGNKRGVIVAFSAPLHDMTTAVY